MSAGPARPAGSSASTPRPCVAPEANRDQRTVAERTPERIVLTGFMGAGKSTVGRLLSVVLGWRFFDTDSLVTARHHLSVAEIFAQHGEARFREWEAEAIYEALQHCACVLALGGGAIETPAVRELLFAEPASPATVTVYLEAPLDSLLTRCASAGQTRPLLAAPTAETESRLASRLPFYQRAHYTLSTADRTPGAVVEALLTTLPGLRAIAAAHQTQTRPATNGNPEASQ